MKLSIIIESPCDLEKLISLLRKIDAIQKEGKYIFYRLICVCEEHNEKEFKASLKSKKINVPYSFCMSSTFEKPNKAPLLTDFFEMEFLSNPVEMILLTKKSEITTIAAQIAFLNRIHVSLIDNDFENEMLPIAANYLFPLNNEEDADKIILKYMELYKL